MMSDNPTAHSSHLRNSLPTDLACGSTALRCILWFVLVAFGGVMFSNGAQAREGQPRVLVDAYHSHTWIDRSPSPELDQYHLLHGPTRALAILTELGWQIDRQIAPWTKEALSGCDAIYLNLVSADLPPFFVSEIEAITEFVEQGGGLFLVVDHTNCYYHNHVLGALVDRLGIELRSETLCDAPPNTIGKGNAWVVFNDIRPHEVTRNVERFAVQTGGVLPSEMGIVFSSEEAWGDRAWIPPYGDSNGPGFYGNFVRELGETQGKLASVAAKEFGKG